MVRVPRIDSPCPLSKAEQLRIDGHCGRCNTHVHALDSLDDAQRHALFAAAKGRHVFPIGCRSIAHRCWEL